ncbi:EAL domain-containing protein [Sulfurospirillum deleyianum]|uniref:Diguanylate cyclase n=1 Tax=Sulfurospirillum deleyianum (strain ATCC 51133 / DSM 6946 / 5175) TaxID=525898 RepID=D1B415_SULD5|nr:bifunctional diguanylate cyclase/phosphodiesterase [Sulfurospirillum deleyianum]ACZ12835.1 diguanylate cyclase [Sulfurospirillum deleyianum DSM 6946]
MEPIRKYYAKTGTLFLLVFSPLYLSLWYQHWIFSTLWLTLVGSSGLVYVTTLRYSHKKLKSRLKYNLYTDFNTKLPNRLHFLKEAKKLSQSHESTLILINIDSFQTTNTFYGHAFGDAFLKTIAHWLKNNLPPIEATLYKFEADIYAIFIPAPFSTYNLQKYLKKLSLHITKERIICRGIEIDTTLSIGATQGTKNLLKLASIACKEAKNKRLPYLIYDKNSHKEKEYHYNITMNHTLKEALAKDRVVPFFQPIVNLHNGEIEKFETLMRIHKEEKEYYLPSDFLEIAKHSKIYSKLSMALIQKAFETFQISSNSFSINLSYLDMTNIVTKTFILEKLKEFNVGPWVIFEILESDGIENYEAIATFVEEVKAYGAQIAIDDFGSGYSNFERLNELRVDYIKIDGSLIKNLDRNDDTKVIVKNIVRFAQDLGIKTIAEYVHSADILACVKELGVDYAQGYYIGKPSVYMAL